MDDLKQIIESLLFVSEKPLTLERLRAVLPQVDAREIRAAMQSLVEEYLQRDGGFYINEVAGGYQFRSQPKYKDWIRRLVKPNPVRISKAAMETLAIIAYKQPIIRSDIERLRGVDCGGVLRALLERKLIRVLGRKEIPGRPLIYATTKDFLEVFDLKHLKDLPTPQEIESLQSQRPEPISFPDEAPITPLEETAEGSIPMDTLPSAPDSAWDQEPSEEAGVSSGNAPRPPLHPSTADPSPIHPVPPVTATPGQEPFTAPKPPVIKEEAEKS